MLAHPILSPAERAELLEGRLLVLSRAGWRVDMKDGAFATVSRPTLWMPWWVYVLAAPFSCGVSLVVWGWLRAPSRRRTAMSVNVDVYGWWETRPVPSS